MSRAPLLLCALLLAITGCKKTPDAGVPPHQIHIVGSSAAFPFSAWAAERLMWAAPTVVAPLVRANGDGAGIASFCEGTDARHPDIAVTTRAMTPAETQSCAAHGTGPIDSVPIGHTAFVLVTARSGDALPLTRAALYRALTSTSVRTWADADPRLPALAIRIEGPAADPAIADGLFGLLLTPGCHAAGGASCDTVRIRGDGAYAAHGADAELIASATASTAGAIGILPYAQASNHRDTLRMLPLDGIAPTPENIASGRYPASAPLLLLSKGGPAVPGLPQLLGFYAEGLAPNGAFVARGLVPLTDADRQAAEMRLRAREKH